MPLIYDDRESIHSAAEEAKAKTAAKRDQYQYGNSTDKYTAQGYRSREDDAAKLFGKGEGTGAAALVKDIIDNPGPIISQGANDLAHHLGLEEPYTTDGKRKAGLQSTTSNKVSGSGSGSGSVSSGSSASKDPYQGIIDMIQKTSAANNEWSAQQAQKQMDFQLMMSNTAHQREIEDLKAAGLNPVLSAGGSGASTASGAMAQPDNSNTRLLAEVSLEAINAMQNTASGAMRSVRKSSNGSNSSVGSSLLGRIATSGASGLARSLGYAIGRAIFKR